MKKFVLYCAVLALAAIFVPQSQAAPRCIHLTNFCDSISVDTANDPYFPGGKVLFGGWDWECVGDWHSSSVIGNSASRSVVATRPVEVGGGTPFAYSMAFGFNYPNPNRLFDLLATDSFMVFAIQLNQPWTLTNGACAADDVDRSKPSMMGRW